MHMNTCSYEKLRSIRRKTYPIVIDKMVCLVPIKYIHFNLDKYKLHFNCDQRTYLIGPNYHGHNFEFHAEDLWVNEYASENIVHGIMDRVKLSPVTIAINFVALVPKYV
jgi:hypothetical protein